LQNKENLRSSLSIQLTDHELRFRPPEGCEYDQTISIINPYQFVHYYSAIYMRRANQCKLFICNTLDKLQISDFAYVTVERRFIHDRLSYSLRLFYPPLNNPLYSLFFILTSSVVTLTRTLKGKVCI